MQVESVQALIGMVSLLALLSCKNLQNLEKKFKEAGIETAVVLMSEIFPDKLCLFEDIDA